MFWPHIGGGEIFATRLLMALRTRHQIIVVTRQDASDLPSEDRFGGVPVYRLPFWTALEARDMGQMTLLRRRLRQLKQTFAPDLIHAHNFGPSLFFYLETAHVHPAPLLLTLQLEILPKRNTGPETLMGRALRAADWVSCVSHATLAQVRHRVPETTDRSSVIFNSVDFPSFSPRALDAEAPRLLCLGRLHAQKGFDLALVAFAKVIDRFPRARLIIAGDGPERSTLERRVAELNLMGAVDFEGWVSPDEVLALMNNATIVVMPSRYEGFPLVALEAASMARPIVASRISGLSEIVLHQNTGLLIEPEDHESLADGLIFLLTHPEQATQMGRAGRSRVRKLFNWKHCVEAYDTLYHSLALKSSYAGQPSPWRSERAKSE